MGLTTILPSLLNLISRKTARQGFAIVSTREDGLCQRINTILDAMLVAKAMGATFAYHWDETAQPALDHQTTASLAAVFDADFRRHHLPGTPDPRCPTLNQPLRDAAAVAAARAAGQAAGRLLLDRPHRLGDVFPALGSFPPDGYATAFDAIGFARPVRAAIAAARAVPVAAGAAVIHLRGGDILHGTHSFHGAYLHKAPSLTEIDASIRNLQGEGRTVWLIGQEPDIQAAMVARHPGTRAFGITEPWPIDLTPVGAVLFDAVFMSRMSQILGGKSGVTRLAQRLGSAGFSEIGRPDALALKGIALPDDPDIAFPRVSVAAKAHVFSKVVVAAPPDRWTSQHLTLIRIARSLRPANAFLQLVETCVTARLIGAAEGERAARTFLKAPPLEPGILPDMGFAFLMGGAEYFPRAMVAGLDPTAGPATALLGAVGDALRDPTCRPRALAALASADAALAPASINPALRDRILFCINGNAGHL